MKTCEHYKIQQGFTKVKTPRTNGKAERVIRTIMEMCNPNNYGNVASQNQIHLIATQNQ